MMANSDNCPVSEDLISRLYRAPKHSIDELVSGLSTGDRGRLATFCYARAHFREIGFAVAATCDLETLAMAGGIVGTFLFEMSREFRAEEKPSSYARQAKISLAPVGRTALHEGA
jgi:hypothetical protein